MASKKCFNNRNVAESLGRVPRHWLFLPTLDAYVLREFLTKFCILLLVATVLFLLSDVLDDLSDFLDADTPWHTFSWYYLLKIPGNIRFVLPISTLLGCIWTMAAFGKNMEVTAMRASGISLLRCGGPILLMGLLTTFVNIWFNENLVPRTERMTNEIFITETKSDHGKKIEDQKLAYKSPDKYRTWLFQLPEQAEGNLGVVAYDGTQHDVAVKFYRKNGTLAQDLWAKNAIYRDDNGWNFEDVTLTPYSEDGLMPLQSYSMEKYNLPIDEAPETPVDIQNSVKKVEDLPSWVILDLLVRTREMSQRSKDVYWSVFFYRLAFPWSCFLAVFLGIPLATRNERSGIMSSILSAVGAIVIYIVLAQVFLVLGKQGYLNCVVAGLAPTVGFILYGAYRVIWNRA